MPCSRKKRWLIKRQQGWHSLGICYSSIAKDWLFSRLSDSLPLQLRSTSVRADLWAVLGSCIWSKLSDEQRISAQLSSWVAYRQTSLTLYLRQSVACRTRTRINSRCHSRFVFLALLLLMSFERRGRAQRTTERWRKTSESSWLRQKECLDEDRVKNNQGNKQHRNKKAVQCWNSVQTWEETEMKIMDCPSRGASSSLDLYLPVCLSLSSDVFFSVWSIFLSISFCVTWAYALFPCCACFATINMSNLFLSFRLLVVKRGQDIPNLWSSTACPLFLFTGVNCTLKTTAWFSPSVKIPDGNESEFNSQIKHLSDLVFFSLK